MFTSPTGANVHKDAHIPFLCPFSGCRSRFWKKEEMIKHAQDLSCSHGSYFLCPLPFCTYGATQRPIDTSSRARKHINYHQQNGELSCGVFPQFTKRNPLSHFELFWQLLHHNFFPESAGGPHTGLKKIKIEPTSIDSPDNEGDDMNMESFATSSVTPEDAFQFGSGSVLSKEQRSLILETNINTWSKICLPFYIETQENITHNTSFTPEP